MDKKALSPRSPRSSASSARFCDEAGRRPLDGHRDVSSGSLGLDIALGVGACRAGGWSKSTGRNPQEKPTLALHTVAEGQKKGGICAFIDAEHALDPVYARSSASTSTNC